MVNRMDQLSVDGVVVSGYDYNLNVRVENGVILDCEHPVQMKQQNCCNSHRLAGHLLREIQGHEIRYGNLDVAI